MGAAPLEKLKNYRPTEKEPFMNDRQRDYFRAKLLAWKDEILRESKITLQTLQEENVNHPDLADRASSETDRAIELRARDRQRKLISKIDAALQRIEDNTYGYCEETGEPISLHQPGDAAISRHPSPLRRRRLRKARFRERRLAEQQGFRPRRRRMRNRSSTRPRSGADRGAVYGGVGGRGHRGLSAGDRDRRRPLCRLAKPGRADAGGGRFLRRCLRARQSRRACRRARS